MKLFYILSCILLNSTLAAGQHFNIKELIEFTGYSINKFDNYIEKKDFKRNYYSLQESANVYDYILRKKKEETIERMITYEPAAGEVRIHYQTSSQNEQAALLEQLKAAGFSSYNSPQATISDSEVLQHGNMRAYTRAEIKDSTKWYTIVIERKDLPKAKDIQYAEDLLPISSHEYLCYVFGAQAVKKDVFYYSETETNKCSVLFPNTNRQLIFIWNDEKNYRNTAFILVGGQLQTTNTSNNNLTIEHNLWRSKQGVYTGMALRELQQINEEPVNFYSWQQDQAGMLAPKNHGKLDFNKIGLVLNCLNCNDDKYQQASIISSESQLEQDKKVYISTIVILPGKEKQATASR